MAEIPTKALSTACRAVSRNAKAVIAERGMKDAHLANAVERAGGAARKTVYNVLGGDKGPMLESVATIAEELGIPLWALMIEGLWNHPELLRVGALKPLERLVQNYLESTPARRADIEKVGESSAHLSTIKG